MSFWGELKRRNVFKAGAAYVIAAWLIVQVANTFFPILHLPQWTVTFIAALLILGLPVALILAWAYELTPEGVKLTKKVPLAESITHVTGRKLNYVLGCLLIVAVGYIIALQFFISKSPVQTDVASTVSEQTPAAADVEEAPKTIAVLPFDNLSSDPEQEYFVAGLSEEIINSLAQIPQLNVTGKTSSFSFKGTNKKIQEIANELGVAHILEGSVRKAGNELRITAQLIRADDGFHLFSKTYDRELKDIFAVQEDIAASVANELKIKLGIGKSFKRLGGTDNVEAYELYLAVLGKEFTSINDANRALELLNRAITIDPEFALAWAYKAATQHWFSLEVPADMAAKYLDDALISGQKAVQIEPHLSEGYISLGHVKTGKSEYIAAEKDFRKAFGLKDEPLLGASMYISAASYHAVDNIKRAHEILVEARENDPLNEGPRCQYIFNLAFQNDRQGAEVEYERGLALFGDKWESGDAHITIVRLSSGDAINRDEIVYSDSINDMSKEHLDSPKEGLEALRQFYANDNNLSSSDFAEIALWASYFGDSAFAMECMEKSVRIQGLHSFFFWFPVMHEVRQLPRFKELVKENGLVDYWEKFGWPDLCHPTDNGDFECD